MFRKKKFSGPRLQRLECGTWVVIGANIEETNAMVSMLRYLDELVDARVDKRLAELGVSKPTAPAGAKEEKT